MTPEEFIARWSPSGGAERANYVLFLSELCDLLGVPKPDPTQADESRNAYVFEKDVPDLHDDGGLSQRRIDLYRRGAFVLEAKQGVEKEVSAEEALLKTKGKKKKGHGTRGTKGWDTFMRRAREQAERYARLLPTSEGRPPFLLVVDVGHVIEVYAEFTRTGGAYLPFPSARAHQIRLTDLAQPEVRELLRTIWLDPLSLDPSIHAAEVTKDVARKLAEISRSMEGQSDAQGQAMTPERVSQFLMRMIFTMFAEDVGLLPTSKFRDKLKSLTGRPQAFVPTITDLWQAMAKGGYSVALEEQVKHFNGGLFEGVEVLPVTDGQLQLFIEAAEHDWSRVEPSIFGTLVERALNPRERHRLGAHYTPRAYVERLVHQVVMEPLREDWRTVQVQVQDTLDQGNGDDKARVRAQQLVAQFHAQLRQTQVLDPACGTGNFIYVSMELIKRLEAEVIETLVALGGLPPLIEVNPEQFHGIEVNPRAASVAELVLWIGYLQLYAREHGNAAPPEPILRAFHNIENRDAVLSYSHTTPKVDRDGQPVTRWDGVSTLVHPVTGRDVPDASKTVQDSVYHDPQEASWPQVDFIVGNPPFIGAGPMRETLGDGYTETVRQQYPTVPDSADFVMFWWDKAARTFAGGRLRRFGFVTTNSIKQTFNRRVMARYLGEEGELGLTYAIPDHPWVDERDGAAVRIAMTVAQQGKTLGLLDQVVQEQPTGDGEYAVVFRSVSGPIHPDLTVGADVTGAQPLKAMEGVSNPGVKLHGAGFIVPKTSKPDPKTGVTPTSAVSLGLGTVVGLDSHIREYRNGKDLTARPRGVMVIDLFGLSAEDVQQRFPKVYEHVLMTVKPERDAKAHSKDGAGYARWWWLFGKPRQELRRALSTLPRYIATVETSKHRFFQFLDAEVLPDNMLVAVASDDAYVLGVLSSRVHVTWALAQGSRLGVGNDPRYNKTRCFETFPFPAATPEQQQRIRDLAERLDAHRKARLAEHPRLTMTDMYNALAALRAGQPLAGKLKTAHDQGLVTTLKQLHDDLDAAVLAAYGWPEGLDDQGLLVRLAALNTERVQEEKAGRIRYLRPEYQDPQGAAQENLGMAVARGPAKAAQVMPFPTALPLQVQAVRSVLMQAGQALSSQEVAQAFQGAKEKQVEDIMQTLVLLGQAHLRQQNGEVKYAA